MRTLYERLRSPYKEQLEKDYQKYPNSIGDLILTLKLKQSWLQLTVAELYDLINYSCVLLDRDYNLTKLNELFDEN